MRHKLLQLSAILLLGFCLTEVQSQDIHQTIPAAGGTASGSGGKVNYSVGQVVYSTNTGTTGSVIQGIQQPYEIWVVTGIEEAKEINLLVSAYPNPTIDCLKLKVDNFDNTNLSYQLLDINGKLLISNKLIGNETSIDMSKLVSAIYFLKVIDNNKEFKSFKIIKN